MGGWLGWSSKFENDDVDFFMMTGVGGWSSKSDMMMSSPFSSYFFSKFEKKGSISGKSLISLGGYTVVFHNLKNFLIP